VFEQAGENRSGPTEGGIGAVTKASGNSDSPFLRPPHPSLTLPAQRDMHVFEWTRSSAWGPIVVDLMSDIVTDQVVTSLRKRPPKYFVSDESSWLDEATLKAGSFQEPDCFSVLAQRLPSVFKAVVAYHACRPGAPHIVAAEGLRVLDPRRLQEDALALFDAPEESILASIEELDVATREGVVHLALDDVFLIQRCGHYLIYGSETMQGIAANLQRRTGRDAFGALRSRGIPTIFVCELPLQLLDPGDVLALAATSLTKALESTIAGHPPPSSIDFTLTLKKAVPPHYIVRHYHPDVIPNPHEGYRPCRIASASCSLCSA